MLLCLFWPSWATVVFTLVSLNIKLVRKTERTYLNHPYLAWSCPRFPPVKKTLLPLKSLHLNGFWLNTEPNKMWRSLQQLLNMADRCDAAVILSDFKDFKDKTQPLLYQGQVPCRKIIPWTEGLSSRITCFLSFLALLSPWLFWRQSRVSSLPVGEYLEKKEPLTGLGTTGTWGQTRWLGERGGSPWQLCYSTSVDVYRTYRYSFGFCLFPRDTWTPEHVATRKPGAGPGSDLQRAAAVAVILQISRCRHWFFRLSPGFPSLRERERERDPGEESNVDLKRPRIPPSKYPTVVNIGLVGYF